MLRSYFYKLLAHYLTLYVRPGNSLLEVDSGTTGLACHLPGVRLVKPDGGSLPEPPEYIVLNGNVHYEKDVQSFFQGLHPLMNASTRVIVLYYSSLWKPLMQLATWLGVRRKQPELNWVSPEDIENFFRLSDLELVRQESKVLLPVYIPIISYLCNRYLAPLPFFRLFTMVNIAVARPVQPVRPTLSASIVVPARNEAGNIENIIRRIPVMGPDDEIIFVEGNSTDNTWQVIQEMALKYGKERRILIAQQEGKGKGDAVRKGYSLATRDILMILDADLTVPAEDLPRFYRAITEGKGEFINGSRLVYPMEKEAMRFFNILGNKFFAMGFSFVLGQRFKDTLCGTKVLTRDNYWKLAAHRSYFGNFDPFGDFDLIFGAARLGLKIIEVPISYKERTYGSTNIQRWKHGVILLRMLVFAANKFKFV
ncbi:MAG: Glycosyltransferase [uncultured Cytophagales bacterium]|uniref:Glycosyltransferase n=1 Tax=uncultured Cytophagales bacterium TaxID=158755 RepID=A0A6J4KL57_9SPHI|nr:MAG: Glycosyltransferase [uncultured Cytophagales bacterium]